jgi:hypothetical protein
MSGQALQVIVKNGETYNISSRRDLEKLEKDQLISIVEWCLTERNLFLRGELNSSNSKMHSNEGAGNSISEFQYSPVQSNIHESIDEAVKSRIQEESLHQKSISKEFNKRISALEESFLNFQQNNQGDIKSKTFSARKIAHDADRRAMTLIFPECSIKPFFIGSLSSLLKFLYNNNDPSNLIGPESLRAWSNFSNEKRTTIIANAKKIERNFKYLTRSIGIIKAFAWKQLDYTETTAETIDFFRRNGDVQCVEALNECLSFLQDSAEFCEDVLNSE